MEVTGRGKTDAAREMLATLQRLTRYLRALPYWPHGDALGKLLRLSDLKG